MKKIKIPYYIKNIGALYFMLVALLIPLNITFVPPLFQTGGEILGTDFGYLAFWLIDMAVLLFGLIFAVPALLSKGNHREEDSEAEGTQEDCPMWKRLIVAGLPICALTMLQTLAFAVCALASEFFDLSVIRILFVGIMVCGAVYLWMLICAVLYRLAGSGGWYLLGQLVLNFAFIIIADGCLRIYNSNPLLPHREFNPFVFNIFALSGLIPFSLSYVSLILLVIVVAAFAFIIWRNLKKKKALNFVKTGLAYKIVTIILFSLSVAFLAVGESIKENTVSAGTVGLFFAVTLIPATGLTFIASRKNKSWVKIIIPVTAVAVAAALAMGIASGAIVKKGYSLPEETDIKSINIRIDTYDDMEMEAHLDDCLAFHKTLLELFEEGYGQDPYTGQHPDADCLADVYNSFIIRYSLNNGRETYREYHNLNNAAFDEAYIKFLQSDAYEYSLKNTTEKGAEIEFSWCEEKQPLQLTAMLVQEILVTYCKELQSADREAFYEEYGVITFTKSKIRKLYVPASFTETRALMEELFEQYYVKN